MKHQENKQSRPQLIIDKQFISEISSKDDIITITDSNLDLSTFVSSLPQDLICDDKTIADTPPNSSASSCLSSSSSPSVDATVYNFTITFPKPVNYIIPKSSYESLLSSTGQLYSDVIESYMLSHSKLKYDLYFLPFPTATDIAFNGKSTIRKANKLSKYNFIAGPVHKKGKETDHWSLIFINVSSSSFYYFDSLKTSQINSSSYKVFDNFCNFSSDFLI